MRDNHIFGGKTFDIDVDGERLSTQVKKVFWAMQDGCWRTLQQISGIVDAPEPSVSARLRDLRKSRYGGHHVEGRRCGLGGLWEYRMGIPQKSDG